MINSTTKVSSIRMNDERELLLADLRKLIGRQSFSSIVDFCLAHTRAHLMMEKDSIDQVLKTIQGEYNEQAK